MGEWVSGRSHGKPGVTFHIHLFPPCPTHSSKSMQIDFEKSGGLVPAIVQDAVSLEVLMVAFMNEEAWTKTIESGFATFWSRSRNKLWLKGESSGHKLVVKEILIDCDQDTVLLKVEALGPGVCHEGYRSCFFRTLVDGEWKITGEKGFDPDAVYARGGVTE